jgi:hypothetical protein
MWFWIIFIWLVCAAIYLELHYRTLKRPPTKYDDRDDT